MYITPAGQFFYPYSIDINSIYVGIIFRNASYNWEKCIYYPIIFINTEE